MDQEGSFKALKREDFRDAILMFKKNVDTGCYVYPSERNETANFIINACASVKEARHQGDPFIPEVIAQMDRDRRNARGYIYLGGSDAMHVVHMPGTAPAAARKHSLIYQASRYDKAGELPAFGPPSSGKSLRL
jgi:hypothetical protein